MTKRLSRRRTLTLLAAAAGVPLVAGRLGGEVPMLRWDGRALGAPARISLYGADRPAAEAALADAVRTLERLEGVFSLYRADSALRRLNRDGRLDDAPPELIAVIDEAIAIAGVSDGAFDPTVQPLWQLYFRHFTAPDPDPAGPSAAALAAARALVDWRRIALEPAAGRVRLTRPGTALTLNGIAQGFITDRIAAGLRRRGFDRTLVDMGEPRALAAHPDGRAWRIGVADPRAPSRAITVVELVDQAVATSGGYGTLFDGAGRFTHLIDPKTGATAPALAGVTVVAARAARADALSTALAVAPTSARAAIARAGGAARALAVDSTGRVTELVPAAGLAAPTRPPARPRPA